MGNINDEYMIFTPEINKDEFGTICKAVHKLSSLKRAVRIINKEVLTTGEKRRLVADISVVQSLDHPNLIKIYDFFQDSKSFYIVTELCEGGDLFRRLEKKRVYEESEAKMVIRQVLSAMSYCHKEHITHRDFKPESVYYDSKTENSILKVSDFGTAIKTSSGNKSELSDVTDILKHRSCYYISPENLRGDYSEPGDIWSVGVLLYALICGCAPFCGRTDMDALKKIKKGKLKFKTDNWERTSEDCMNLVKRMLISSPKKRITAEEALQHPWLANTNNLFYEQKLLDQIFSNMKKYKIQIKLQEAFWLFITSFLLTKEEKASCAQGFLALNAKGDGALSQDDLFKGLSKTLSEEEAAQTAKSIMDNIDSNKSGSIDFYEFLMASINKSTVMSRHRLKVAFRIMDKVKIAFCSSYFI